MKVKITVILLVCLSCTIFAQGVEGDITAGLQYGTARVFDDGRVLRKISEPGLVLALHMLSDNSMGLFAQIGVLFPGSVTEGGVTLSYSSYDVILFVNGAAGLSYKVPMADPFSFVVDAGFSINDLYYSGSFRDTIDATWKIKIHNLGATYYGGHRYDNIRMTESYNDVALGIMGNAALRMNFSPKLFLEFAVAASFDFLRIRSYKFYADFTSGGLFSPWQSWAYNDFSPDKLEGVDDTAQTADKLVLETDTMANFFKQYTLIPRICIGVRLK